MCECHIINKQPTNKYNKLLIKNQIKLKPGFYTLKGQDGRDRRVDYVADASGFRATISTNELGTAPKDPADGKFST